jgi:hypothetical protein
VTTEEKLVYCVHRGYAITYYDYWATHPICEICHSQESQPPHHIKTRGAGGEDTEENLLSLCSQHHAMIHAMGDAYVARYAQGAVGDKIIASKMLDSKARA